MSNLIFEQETYKILGACFEVYKEKGFGFTEPIYQECLALEFGLQEIPFLEQAKIQIDYKGKLLNQYFVPDFICYDKIIVEIKAISNICKENISQTINYLNTTEFELALLVNFGHYPKIEHKRLANNKSIAGKNRLIDEINCWIEK